MQGDFIHRLNRIFGGIAGWSFDHRWWVVAFSILVLIGSLALAMRVQTDSSYEAYFDPGDRAYLAYEEFREDFGSDEISYILYEAPAFEYGPWNLEVMRKIIELTEVLEDEVPFIYEVTSVANAELMEGSEFGIEILELRDEFPETQEELLALRDRYLSKPMLVGGILSADANHAAIIIEMDRTSTDPLDDIRLDPEGGDGLDNLYPQVTDFAIREILARPEYEGIIFHHSGDVPLNAIYNVIIAEESGLLGLTTAGVIALIMLFFFRSFVGVAAPVLVVYISVLLTVAFMVLVGWKLDLSFSSVPTLLTAIGVAHSVHILSQFRSAFVEIGDRREALVETLHLVGTPCLLTSLTTAVGFASMSFVPIKSIAHMGVYSGFGVLIAFVLSLTFLMSMLSFGRSAPRTTKEEGISKLANQERMVQQALRAVAHFVVRRRGPILIAFGAVFAVSLLGITRLVVDSNWLDDFSDDVEVKSTALRVDEVMGGVTNLVLLFDGGDADSIKEPTVLWEMERLQEWADDQPLVRKTYSIVDIIKDLNQIFNEDDSAFFAIPETREMVAQYLLLYESAGGAEAEEYVSSDHRRAYLELRLALGMTSETAALVEALNEELEARPWRRRRWS